MNTSRFACLALAFPLMAGLASPRPAEAQRLEAYASASTQSGSDTQETGFLPNLPSVTASAAEDGIGSASAAGYAAYGMLGTYAADTAPTAGLLDYNTSAQGRSSFTDILMVGSGSLAPGTPVSLVFTVSLTGSLDAEAGVIPFGGAGNSAGDINAGLTVQLDGLNQVSAADNADSNGLSQDTFPLVVTTAVGNMLPIAGSLQSSASTNGVGGFALSDFSHTARFYADAATPGVTLTSASGHDYSSPAPVPEASVAVSLGMMLGLGGLVAGVRARRRSPI